MKDEDGCGQRIVAQLASAAEPGVYTLVITTHGYATPDGDIDTYSQKVTAVGAA